MIFGAFTFSAGFADIAAGALSVALWVRVFGLGGAIFQPELPWPRNSCPCGLRATGDRA